MRGTPEGVSRIRARFSLADTRADMKGKSYGRCKGASRWPRRQNDFSHPTVTPCGRTPTEIEEERECM